MKQARLLHSTILIIVLFISIKYDSLPATVSSKPVDQYSFDIWDTYRGFPYFAIHAIRQTRDGYLWLATDEGLVRFDGVQFTLYDKDNTPAITHNDISSLIEDTTGNLWFGTRGGGLGKFREGIFEQYTTVHGLSGSIIQSLCLGKNNSLWVGIESFGLNHIVDGKFDDNLLPAGSDVLTVYAVYETRDGTLLIGAGGLQRKPVTSTNFEIISSPHLEFVKAIVEDRNGTQWIGTNRGLFYIDETGVAPCTIAGAPGASSISCLYEDRHGNLWVGTEGNGLYRLSNNTFTTFTMKDGLSSDRILSLAEDQEGNIWVGTRGGGLNRLRNQTLTTFSVNNGLSGEYITALFEDRTGTLWVGIKDHGVESVQDGIVTGKYTFGSNTPLNHIRAIEEDANGNIILGTMRGVVILEKISSGKRKPVVNPGAFNQISRYSIRSVQIMTNGDALLGTYGGGVWKYSGGKLEEMMPGSNIRAISKAPDGSIWVASKGGVACLKKGVVEKYSPSDGLSSDEAFSLYCENDSTVWVGTYGGGINRIRQGKVSPVTKKEGLFDNVIYAILDDGSGNFWMSCNRGIFRVRKSDLHAVADGLISTLSCVSYGVEDGMESVECNGGSQPSGWKSNDGKLYFATVKGFVIIDPNNLRSGVNEIVPRVELIITESDTLLPGNQVVLPLGKRRFEIHFTGISFLGAERILFRHRLEGNDNAWNNSGTLRKAYYTNIAPGNYVFKVTANSPEGRWDGNEARMSLTVPSYFWETWWFKATIALCLLLIVFGTARAISTRALKRQLRELEARQALEQERSRISKDMHDEVGASLTQIAILSALLERNITNREAAESYLKKISATAHDVVGSLDEIIWFINPKHDTLESLLLYIREYLAGYFESAELQCRFDFPDAIPASTLSADIRRSVFLVIKEAAHNIVKHANASVVNILVRVDDIRFEIMMTDDGKGIAEENRSLFSNGISNMKKRMEDIGGLFDISSVEGKGTKVTIKSKVEG